MREELADNLEELKSCKEQKGLPLTGWTFNLTKPVRVAGEEDTGGGGQKESERGKAIEFGPEVIYRAERGKAASAGRRLEGIGFIT